MIAGTEGAATGGRGGGGRGSGQYWLEHSNIIDTICIFDHDNLRSPTWRFDFQYKIPEVVFAEMPDTVY